MENASKALIMAGSVLLSLLIIGALVYMFNQLGIFSQSQADNEAAKKLAEYNKEIETFNKETLYGSELLSLANLIDDYNKRQSDIKGYNKIELGVTMTAITGENGQPVIEQSYMGENAYSKLLEDFNKVNNELNNLKKQKIVDKKILEWVGMTDDKITEYLQEQNKISEYAQIKEVIGKYNNLEAIVKELKNKKFKKQQVEYDPTTNKIGKIVFRQIEDLN